MSKETKGETLPAVIGSYAVMQRGEKLREIMAANVGTGGVSPFDIDRIKVPSGGGTTWEVPSLTGVVETKELRGVVIAWRDARSFWRESFDATGGGTPPDCSSDDGISGQGDPGGDCAVCPLSQFESEMRNGKPGRGQACKQTRLLFVVREGDMLPILVVVPPSSLAVMRKFFLRLASSAVPFYGVVTELTLSKTKNKDGIAYGEIVPKMVAQLSPEECDRMRAYAAIVAPVLAVVRVDRADMDAQEAA